MINQPLPGMAGPQRALAATQAVARRGRYACDECGGVGSKPTHKPECSRSRFSLMRLPMMQLIAEFNEAYPARARFVPVMSREALVSALLEVR